MFEYLSKKIFVAGHRGLVGSALVRTLKEAKAQKIITKTRQEVDLRNQAAVREFFAQERPEVVLLAAARVGGIMDNSLYPGDFALENLQIQTNVIHSAFEFKVQKLVFLGSACVYPKFAEVPVREDALMTGALEPTNDAFAVAKIAGIYLCRALRQQYGADYISVMPSNIYGPGDTYDLVKSHVMPSLILKFHRAKTEGASKVTLWGSGRPTREFIYSDDLARGILQCLESYSSPEMINVSGGKEVPILELADRVRKAVGFDGDIEWDASKPDGTPRRCSDNSKIFALGWTPQMDLQIGIEKSYADFLSRGLG